MKVAFPQTREHRTRRNVYNLEIIRLNIFLYKARQVIRGSGSPRHIALLCLKNKGMDLETSKSSI